MEKMFRCPFEVKGSQEGTIIEVTLSEDKEERLKVMLEAIGRLYLDTSRSAIRFILPRSLRERCASNEELQQGILPYQAEFLAADIDRRLYPFLPYHHAPLERLRRRFLGRNRYERLAAEALCDRFSGSVEEPKNVLELSEFIRALFEPEILKGQNPFYEFGRMTWRGKVYRLFCMDPSAFVTFKEQDRLADPKHNNVLFTIVKSPFYPKAFGRYSDEVELVVTRDVDVNMLSPELKTRIRRQANEVHAAHGVYVPDLDETRQPAGLWIPEKRKNSL